MTAFVFGTQRTKFGTKPTYEKKQTSGSRLNLTKKTPKWKYKSNSQNLHFKHACCQITVIATNSTQFSSTKPNTPVIIHRFNSLVYIILWYFIKNRCKRSVQIVLYTYTNGILQQHCYVITNITTIFRILL